MPATVEALAGNKVRFAMEFIRTTDGAPVDPSPVHFIYETPAGIETTLVYLTDAALVRDRTGNFHVEVAGVAGVYYYEWRGFGTNMAAAGGYYIFTPSRFA